MKNYYKKIYEWIFNDPFRLDALKAVRSLNLKDCYIAAGFLRNLAWDKYHHYQYSTPLNDVDVIFFDPDELSEDLEAELEARLSKKMGLPWSVKNQARMHISNNCSPYLSSIDAMQYWPECETAVGMKLNDQEDLEIISPFNLESLFNGTVTRNEICLEQYLFSRRLEEKAWLATWPKLKAVY